MKERNELRLSGEVVDPGDPFIALPMPHIPQLGPLQVLTEWRLCNGKTD